MMNGVLQRTFQPVLLILTLAVVSACGSRAVGEAPVAPATSQGTSAASVTAAPTVLVAALSPTTAPTHLPEPTAAPSTATPTQTAIPSSTPTLEPTASATATATPTATPAPTATVEPSPTPTPEAGPLSAERLVAALRRGGYVLYFRHAATQPTPDDQVPVDLPDCTTQRNLSEAGRAQSLAIGQAIERLGIPIGEVLASPFCRSLDTARLAFGRATPEYGVENLETVKDDAERDARVAAARRLLSTPPEGGTNTVIVAHGNILSAAARVTVAEGGAAIFRPEGNGRFSLVAIVTPEEWGEMNL